LTNSKAPRRLPPGEYCFEDLIIGDHYDTGHIVVTEAHIVGFAGLSGDFFDLHVDDEFARSHGFPARVAHGLLGLAMADGLKNRSSVRIVVIAALGWNWSFRGPILAGDRIGVAIVVNA
jgi:acyl dehydratase